MTNAAMGNDDNVAHVLGISGGKDSTALAVYLRDRIPNMHYYFCDTGEELQETYEYLSTLETYLGKPVTRLNPERPFSHYLKIYGGLLPSPQMRWCTAMLKLKPFEDWIESTFAGKRIKSYVAIRADEHRSGYISHKPAIETVYPFKDDGIDKDRVFQILEDAGLGLPRYYEWRTRSGCYFCFFQRRAEWVGLKERHPDLYDKAKSFEKVDEQTGRAFNWSQRESLIQLEKPERLAQIKEAHAKAMERELLRGKPRRLADIFDSTLEREDIDEPCMICHL